MTQKHTPGPWTVDERGNVRADMPNDSDCILIADVIYAPLGLDYGAMRTREMTCDEQKANAALIAAAPETAAERDRLKKINADLLEALIWMMGHAAAHEDILRDNNLMDSESIYLSNEAHEKARAAIAKAEGR